ncbi:PREDICTED: nucleolus and neural progenitor protein [Crocodylus porosus]|uniref:Nucleolus and neural progenitor protein n=1 Tax=Crocodylus porosus TaxID=8502 RepID=A0A7M4FT72_CROPO|nr:PREDICTED: nucleolus and neural progenitor protein [Crocodylus porosus]
MAAPGLGEAAWNRVNVPWPATSSTVALPEQHPSVRFLPAVSKECSATLTWLNNKAVDAEGRVLHAILYVCHSKMSHHKTYLSLKQVEQSLKRLNLMNLVGYVQDLAELCSKKNKSENPGERLVPSQPVMEVVAVKVLGGCKLLLRLLDCCCKAFLLTIKHLCLEEFILLNTVVSGLLSRLWILYRCVLQRLTSLYGALSGLLQKVSKTQQMPYVKGFTFPSEIAEFLGVNLSVEIKKRKSQILTTKKASRWLNKVFSAEPETAARSCVKEGLAIPPRVKVKMGAQRPVDIGKPVLVKRTNQGKHLGLDVKTFCRQLKARVPKDRSLMLTVPEAKVRPAPLSSCAMRSQHGRSLVLTLREAHCFRELSEALRTAILWFRSKKLRAETCFLKNKLLKSNRLQHVEAQGCSLQKKLSCVKASISKFLLSGSQNAHLPKQYYRLRSCWQRRIRMKLSRKSKKTPSFGQQNVSAIREGHRTNAASFLPAAKPFKKQEKVGTSELKAGGRNPWPLMKGVSENDDIDNIFAVVGV